MSHIPARPATIAVSGSTIVTLIAEGAGGNQRRPRGRIRDQFAIHSLARVADSRQPLIELLLEHGIESLTEFGKPAACLHPRAVARDEARGRYSLLVRSTAHAPRMTGTTHPYPLSSLCREN